MVEVAELYADGNTPREALISARHLWYPFREEGGTRSSAGDVASALVREARRDAAELLTIGEPGLRMAQVVDLFNVSARLVARHVASSAALNGEDAEGANRIAEEVFPAAIRDGLMRNCDLLRDSLGNPFRPVALDPRWLTSTVIDLARLVYEERAFDRLPILADALMDAGCDSEELLAHCRSAGPHARGCWAVDLLLGKH